MSENYMIIGPSGNIIESSGTIKGDTKLSSTVYKMLQDTSAILQRTPNKESFKKLTIAFDDVTYVVTMSKEKIFVNAIQ